MFEGAQPYLHPSYPLHQPSLRVADINVLHYQIRPDIWTGVLQVGVNLSGHLDGSFGPPAPYLSGQLDGCYAYYPGSWWVLVLGQFTASPGISYFLLTRRC